jgi:hypothetical protein
VGFCRWEKPTVNHRTIDRGYRSEGGRKARMQAELEKEVQRLKIQLEVLERYLATAKALPILGPTRLEAYHQDVDSALESLNL